MINHDEFDNLLEKIYKQKRKDKKKFYWNDAIQSQDKDNGLNKERKNLNPTVIIKKNKRIGINKKRASITYDDNFNVMNK